MLFFPYKLDADLYRVPFLTVFVCLACVFVFVQQRSADSGYGQRVAQHCRSGVDPNLQAIFAQISIGSERGCVPVLLALRDAGNREAMVAALAVQPHDLVFHTDRAKDLEYKTAKLTQAVSDFDLAVPPPLTGDLAYDPSQLDVVRMMTSTFAHAGWSHLIGNLIFFFIFASFVESAVGYLYYAVIFVVIAIAASLAYSYSVGASSEALPSIGLSGVVMGMLALITALMPRAHVRCFFWFLLFVRRFRIPLLLLAAWYVGWDIYSHYFGDGASNTNYVAHIGGAAAGLAIGLLFRWIHRDRMRELAAEMPH